MVQTNKMVTSYIALGSNLCNPKKQLIQAVNTLSKLEKSLIVGGSRLYKSTPLGPKDQPDYYNAVIALETALSPEQLLNKLQAIETSQGRVRKEHWGARTLDLDILLYGDLTMQTTRLTIPHAQLHLRNFVVLPLLDISPHLTLPSGQPLAQLSVSNEGLYPEEHYLLDVLCERV